MRRPDGWLRHPNGAQGIASLTIAVDDPEAFHDPMAQVFGSISLTQTDDTLAVHTGHGVLLFVTPDDLDMLHPELEAIAIEAASEGAPTLAALTPHGARSGGHRRLARPARRRLPARLRRQRSASPPEHSHGVMLEFITAGADPRGTAGEP